VECSKPYFALQNLVLGFERMTLMSRS